MKKRSRFVGSVLVLLMAGQVLTGCQSKKEEVTVPENTDVLVDGTEQEASDALSDTIQFEQLAEDSYQERAIARARNLSRIEDVMERAANGEALTIGYIGGSITMGSGASSPSKCYVSLVSDWWTETFPDAEFTFVNAGIGATDSKFGCARCQEDLLAYEPDFVIVEFSVNDSSDTTFAESYESLCRMILESEKNPALLILNMVTYDTGYNAQDIHNQVAFRYDLPVVSMKNSIYEDITNGVLEAKDVSSDMTHPNDTGHGYTAEIVTYFLEKVAAKVYPEDYYEAYELPKASRTLTSVNSVRLQKDTLEAELNEFMVDEETQNGITDVFKNGFEAYNEGDSMTFTVEGSVISLQYRKTKEMNAPDALVIIDGDEENALTISGNYPDGWGDWLYLDTIYNGTAGAHTVEIRLTSSGEKAFYLVSVITAGE